MSRVGLLYCIFIVLFIGCTKPDMPVALLDNTEYRMSLGDSILIDASQSFDPQNAVLEYHWDITPSSGMVVETLFPYRLRVTALDIGEYYVSLQVRNPNRNSASIVSTINVVYPPLANLIAPSVVKLNTRYTLVGEHSYDYYDTPLEYTWSIVPNNTVMIDNKHNKNIVVLFTEEGNYNVMLTVGNTIASSVPVYKTITVSNKPIANIDIPKVVQLDQTFYIKGIRSRSPEDKALNFHWEVSPKEGIHIYDSTAVNTSAIITKDGQYTISLVVDDGEQFSDVSKSTVHTNQAPTAVLTNDIVTSIGKIVSIDASASNDLDGDPLEFYWSIQPESGVTIKDNMRNGERIDLQVYEAGKYIISLRVHDGHAISAVDSITLTTNTTPVARIPTQKIISLNTPIHIDGSNSYDSDGDPLNYTWDITPPLSTHGNSSKILRIKPVQDPGIYTVSLQIYDGYSYSEVATTKLVIRNAYFVDQHANGDATGRSWEHAYTDLQDALDAVTPGIQIWVKAGTYIPTKNYQSDTVRNSRFIVSQGTQLYGGFSGKELYIEDRTPSIHRSILSGDVMQNDTAVSVNRFNDNVYTVIQHNGVDNKPTSIIEGFYITSAHSLRQVENIHSGSGMYIDGGRVRIVNTHFINNSSNGSGAGIYNNRGTVEVINSTFIHNSGYSGAAMYIFQGELSIYNCDIVDNESTEGASILLFYSKADIVNCILVANKGGIGAGIYGIESSIDITNTTIAGNNTTSRSFPKGIAGFFTHSTVSIINSIIYGNSSNSTKDVFEQNIFNMHSEIIYRSSLIEGWSTYKHNIKLTALGDTMLDQTPGFRRMPNILGDTIEQRRGDLHLVPSSVAVNAGDSNLVPLDLADIDNDGDRTEILPFDREYNFRIHPDKDIDLGAFELIY